MAAITRRRCRGEEVNGESGKRRRSRRRRRRKELERAKLEEDSSRRPSRASRRQLFLLENNLGRGSRICRLERRKRKPSASPLLFSPLVSSSKPPHALEPICRGKDIKAARYRDTLGTGDSWSRCCCEITTRGLESGAKWKRKFRWKGDRRNARVARAIREITS